MAECLDPDKKLAYEINKLCLNLHNRLVNLPNRVSSSINKVYLTSLLHPLLKFFLKFDYDEAIINAFNCEYLKHFSSLKLYNNLLWDIFHMFKRFENIPNDSSGSEVTCKICKERVSSSEYLLFQHVMKCTLSPNHNVFMERAVTDFNPEGTDTFGYYCEFCESFFKQSNTSFCSYSYAKTLHSRVCKGLKESRTEVTWIYCDICRVDLCGENVLELHKETIGHKIIELNFINGRSSNDSESLDVVTAEYNFMIKYVNDIAEGVPPLCGLEKPSKQNTTDESTENNEDHNIFHEISRNLKCNSDSNCKITANKSFMSEVVEKTINNNINSCYNAYFCDFCKSWSSLQKDFGDHISSSEHNDNISGNYIQINSCSICKLFIFGNDKTFQDHSVSDKHLTLKYLSETNEKENNNLNSSGNEAIFNDVSNSAQFYCESNDDGYKKEFDNFQQNNSRESKFNLEKHISDSEDSINSLASNSSKCNKNYKLKKFRKGNLNILDKSLNESALEKTSIVVSEFPFSTTRNDVFNAFRSYGFIDNLEFDKAKNSAIVTFKLKPLADLILDHDIPIFINHVRVKLEKKTTFIKEKTTPLGNEGNQIIPNSLKTYFESLANFKIMLSDILIEKADNECYLETPDSKLLHLKSDLERTFQKEIKIIGSFKNGLALSSSSFDLYVDYGNNYFGDKVYNAVSLADVVGKLKCILKSNGNSEFTDICVSNKGNPVLRINNDKKENLCCLFFSNGLVDHNTELIKTYLEIDSRVKDVLLIVKKCMALSNFMSSNNLSGYAVTWMVLFYLMSEKNPVVPPVIALRSNSTNNILISGWDVNFVTDVSKLRKSTNKKTVQQLVHGFFKYYLNDNHLKYILCPLTGDLLKKKKMDDLELPPSYALYKFNLFKKTFGNFPTSRGLCLQDPIQLNNNITYILQDSLLKKFKCMCREIVKLSKTWVSNQNLS